MSDEILECAHTPYGFGGLDQGIQVGARHGGIRPADVPAFIAVQLAGALIALAAGQMLFATRRALSVKSDLESMNHEVRS